MAGTKTYMSAEKIIATEDFLREGPVHTLKIPRTHVDGVVEARWERTSRSARPTMSGEAFQRRPPPRPRIPRRMQFRADWLFESHEAYRAKLEKGQVSDTTEATLAEIASSPSPRRSVATVRRAVTRWAPCR